MSVVIRISAAAFFLVFLIYVLGLVSKGKLQLKYSLLWMVLCIAILICDAFPVIPFWFSRMLGFITPSNFILIVAIAVLFAICLSLSIAVSRLVTAVKNLAQRVALLEKELKDAEKTD